MEIIDIFDTDAGGAFSTTTITTEINKRPWQPNFLGSLGIFTRVPIRSKTGTVVITDQGDIRIIPTSARGGPIYEQTIPVQNIKSFTTPRIAAGDTIMADELQGILSRTALQAGGDFNIVLQDLQSEIAYRMDGPIGLQSSMEATKERMRLGAISGIVLDKDGSVLYDWPSLLGFALPAEIDFNLDAANPTPGSLNLQLRQLKRQILQTAKAGNLPNVRVLALCGHAFFDTFVNQPDIITGWERFQLQAGASATAIVRGLAPASGIDPFSIFPWEGFEFVDYRGTDDNATIAIADDKCKFVPMIPGMFQEILAPGERLDLVNQPGLPVFAQVMPDKDRNSYVRLEVYSYPMYVATRPDVLFSGRIT